MYQQVSHSRILYGALIVFMCDGRISEQTKLLPDTTLIRLVLYNQGGECLLGSMH